MQHVIDIWGGRITSRDDSLRLLLRVDYIFNWAETYTARPSSIISRPLLRKTLPAWQVTVISSPWADPVLSWLNQPDVATESAHEIRNEHESETPISLRALDSEHGVVQHAAAIQSHLQGLHITRSNIQSLLLSFDTDIVGQRFVYKLDGISQTT